MDSCGQSTHAVWFPFLPKSQYNKNWMIHSATKWFKRRYRDRWRGMVTVDHGSNSIVNTSITTPQECFPHMKSNVQPRMRRLASHCSSVNVPITILSHQSRLFAYIHHLLSGLVAKPAALLLFLLFLISSWFSNHVSRRCPQHLKISKSQLQYFYFKCNKHLGLFGLPGTPQRNRPSLYCFWFLLLLQQRIWSLQMEMMYGFICI